MPKYDHKNIDPPTLKLRTGRKKIAGYNHSKIERKWQKEWEKKKIYKTLDNYKKHKFYILDMFPYPSGEGLHVGHPKGYIATDIISPIKRKHRYNVLHPMGFDAFGLPAENFALKKKIHPEVAVKKNIKRFKEQLGVMGLDYDWLREVKTTDPKFYKWTQWIFLKLLEKGLAYESYEPINWCPSCKTGLANEDLEGGRCERCGTIVEKKSMRQWVLKITNYADRLLADLDLKKKDGTPLLNWPEPIKEMQRNWIGKSEGAEIEFELFPRQDLGKIKVFTTRPDTLYGVTYLVLAPEHPSLQKLKSKITNWSKVMQYILDTKAKNEIERAKDVKEKTGVELEGLKAVNPATGDEIPVWVADYVLVDYGTGAVMAVPAHDERDFEFAKKHNLPIKQVIVSGGSVQDGWSLEKYSKEWNEHYTNPGKLVNSGRFDGMNSEEAKKKIINFVGGKEKIIYKLRDWVFSRQRYWGEPIPIIHCPACAKASAGKENAGVIPVPERDLPVELPRVKSYEPTGTGESPLANISKWVNTTCPTCGGKAKRETNTMPQWAGSSWYYLRYMDPKNSKALVDKKKEKYWFGSPKLGEGGVDLYVGGAEHATRHLIYARFWHKFLNDIKIVSTTEPFLKLQSVGLIAGSDGRKMSKRFGNVINPDDIIKTFGADTLRLYEMFMGPFDQGAFWNDEAIVGPRRFLERVWDLQYKIDENKKYNEFEVEKAIKKVSLDIEEMKFNTAISSLMILVNEISKFDSISVEAYGKFLQILAPFAPHVTEELWQTLKVPASPARTVLAGTSIHLSRWPTWNEKLIKDKEVKIVIQINGKVRAEMLVGPDEGEEEIRKKAQEQEAVLKYTKDKNIKKIIYVKNRLVNIVV